MIKLMNKLVVVAILGVLLVGCVAKGEHPGLEFSPQMYHSVAYEPLTQIKDEGQGSWLDSNPADGHGEFYNSNPYNTNKMTMREPVQGTVARGAFLPYRVEKDDLETAATLVNPYDSIAADVIPEGKALYARFCQHCHGAKGQGDGLVGQVVLGVPAYNAGATKDLSAGHIFHVITHGIRRMGAHGSQLSEDERWKIVSYVQTLQNQ
jgi:mono/diheme cytochrome c family protein